MNRHRIAVAGALLCLLVLGFSDTAQAQNALTLTWTEKPAALNFGSVPTGTLSPARTVGVSSTNATTVVVQADQPWLVVNGSNQLVFINTSQGGATNVSLRVNASILTASLTAYTANVTFTIQGLPASVITVPVSVTVGFSSALQANPSTLTFNAVQNSNVGNPSSSNVVMTSTAGTLAYNSSATTQTGSGNWLQLTNGTGVIGGAPITVSVNPFGLSPGTYTGTITVQSTTTTDAAAISVTLTVTASATISLSPTTLQPFLYQVGQGFPPSQSLTVTASAGSVNFSVSMNPTVNWLIASPTFSTASPTATVTLSANPSGLAAGLYTTSVIVTPNGGTSAPAVTVTLVVSNNPLLKLSTSALSFSAQFAGQNPPDQQVQVSTSGGSGSVGFTFSSDSSWLSAVASSTTSPATLTVHVNTQNLQVGNYTGTITVRPTNGDQYTESITVTLTVGNVSTLVAGPPALLFSFDTTQFAPPSQLVQLTSLGQPTSFTLTSSTGGVNCSGGWLQASSNSSFTPATITVSVSTTGLVAGVCSGTVTVTYNSGSGSTSLPIPVTLQIANTALLNINFPQTATGFGLEIAQQNGPTINRLVSLTSTNPNVQVSYQASAISSGPSNWLFVAPNNANTPQQLSVQIVPGGLPSGTYNGSITLGPGFATPASLLSTITIPIVLIVNPNVTVAVTPDGPLSFSVAQNGPLPAAQTLTLTSSGGGAATFTATVAPITGGTWAQVSPGSGQASGQISVSLIQQAVASLSQGTYTNQITLAFQNSATAAKTITLTLTVNPPQTVSVSASSLTFSYQLGSGQSPPSQTLQVTSTGGPVQISVGATSTGGWLSATPTSANTPQTVTVSVNPAGLSAGTLNGTISVSAQGVLTNPIVVNVTFTVVALPVPQPVTITSGPSNVAGAIAPGLPITIKGTLLGPSTAVSFRVNSQGGVDSALSGVQVLFDNIPGTPIRVSATQVDVIVPYEIAGRLSVNVVVVYQGQASPPIQQIVSSVAPGIYTLNFTGQGQAAVINQNFTINGPLGGVTVPGGVISTTPAPQNTVISVYAGGGGQTNPPSATGSVAPTTSFRPLAAASITATIGGVPATVTFAGSAPGFLSGIIQVNILVPTGITGNNLQIVITINGVSSPGGPTVAVASQ